MPVQLCQEQQECLHCLAQVSPSSVLPPAAGFSRCLDMVESNYCDDPNRRAFLTHALMESYLKNLKSSAPRGDASVTGIRTAADGEAHALSGAVKDCEEALPNVHKALPSCSPAEDLSEIIGPPVPFRPESDVDAKREWQLGERYQLGKLLGSGVYGEVRIAWDDKNVRPVAVKRMNNFWESSGDCKRILREVAILSRLCHSHTVQIYDLPVPLDLSSFTDLYIVMELCDASLLEICQHPAGLSLPQARKLVYGILLGCSYLHSAGIYHRDLKPGNCVVNRDCSVKICDFNLSRVVEGSASPNECPNLERALTGFICTPWYRAPEVSLGLGYSEAVDVWSAGCIAAEIFSALNDTGREPRHRALFSGFGSMQGGFEDGPSKRDQLNVIFDVIGTPSRSEEAKLPKPTLQRLTRYARRKGSGLRAKVPAEASDEGFSLIERMIRFLPQRRITMVDALQHAFFEDVTRSPDEQHLASQHIDIGFDEDAIRMGQIVDGDLHAQVRQQLLAEIQKFHPTGLSTQARLAGSANASDSEQWQVESCHQHDGAHFNNDLGRTSDDRVLAA